MKRDLRTGERRPRVVILGAGFAGLRAARALAGAPVEVILIDRTNHHLFQPLLYQVATAGLSPGDIAYPVRALLARQENVRVLMGEARAVNRAARRVVVDFGEVPYDYLILATGVEPNYFDHPDWRALAPPLKDLKDALELRRRILTAFEAAERSTDAGETAALLTFVIVGGGPTGVELAGAIREIAHDVMRRDFRRIDPTLARVLIVESSPRILQSFPDDLARKAARALERLGVELHAGQAVREITPEGVFIGERFIPARTVLWTAGVRATGIAATLDTPQDRAGRLLVREDLTLPDDPRVYVVGDLAHCEHRGEPLPGLAVVAMQQGVCAARNIRRAVAGRPTRPFRYFDRGRMATIGRNRAIAEVFGMKISGRLAWLAWLFVHILFLIGIRNRLSVVIQWIEAYLASRRSARLIIPTR